MAYVPAFAGLRVSELAGLLGRNARRLDCHHDIGMIQGGHGAGFLFEALAADDIVSHGHWAGPRSSQRAADLDRDAVCRGFTRPGSSVPPQEWMLTCLTSGRGSWRFVGNPEREVFMYYARLAILAVSISIGFVASGQPTTGTRSANIAAGKEIFHQNCSICHGMDAKGYRSTSSGLMFDPDSADESRRVPPADLTVLSEHNAGTFPVDRVRDSVYSKISIPAHGTPDMPAWGHVFDRLKSNPTRLEQQLRDLTAYIESIQESKK